MAPRWSPGLPPTGGLAPAVAETHVSLLVFAGDRAYKLKKPLRTPFLDFSSPELRRAACLREVELNRRLAPDVYLGVADVTGPDGTPCDHVVVMRRMPEERRLSRLVASGDGGRRCLEEVAHVLAAFHASARTGADVAAEGTRDAVRRRWEANFSELDPFLDRLPDAGIEETIMGLARAYLAGRTPLFDRRIAQGRIRDGHGDVLADDVYCLDDGPRILDCLEFDDRLRYLDVLDDAAFLAMDLERLGAPEAARHFLAAYRDVTGDDFPPSLAHHYTAYRAHVRAKVACFRHEQGDGAAIAEAHRLLQLTSDHLAAGRVVVTLVGGLPGTGKSTLSASLASARGWAVMRSDEVRKELAGPSPDVRPGGGYNEGLYAPDVTEATYEALLRRAGKLLGEGTSVVLDASWTSAARRRDAAAVAASSSADLVSLRCHTPFDLAVARMAERARRGGDPSDATPEVARAMAAAMDPWPEATAIDTSGTPEEAAGAADKAVRNALRRVPTDPEAW